MKDTWQDPRMRALGEKRLALLKEAAEKSRGKEGLERLDIFLEYGEKLAEGGALPPEEQKALLAAAAEGLPEENRRELFSLMELLGF